MAATDSTALILGETGTGKELFARAIHHRSARGEEQLIKVKCAAIPATLIKSYFFGLEQGAFTGATQRQEGRSAHAIFPSPRLAPFVRSAFVQAISLARTTSAVAQSRVLESMNGRLRL